MNRGWALIVVGLFFFTLGFAWLSSSSEQRQFDQCLARWQGTYESHYTWEAGCRVRIHGKWVPEASVTIRD